MDALELLKQDHRKVGELFKEVEATEDIEEHRQLFEQIRTELETHTHIEETVIYPAFEENDELKDLTLEAYEEHKQMKTLIREIAALSDGSERFDAKLTVLGENVEHHVNEEETELFPKVKNVFDRGQLEQLGQELEAAKKRFGKAQKRATTH